MGSNGRRCRCSGNGRGGSSGNRSRMCRGVRSGGCARRRDQRLFRLDGDIDDVVLFLAEGMHIDVADQFGFHRRGGAVDFLVDRGDVRRRRHLGIGEIEGQRRIEQQRQLLIVQHRRNADAVGHFEHEADEGRLHRSADAYRRALLGFRIGPLQPQRALGGARPLGQFADHLLRQAGRLAAPAIGQEIDEYPLACRHGVDGNLARQRQTDRRAIGIDAGGGDVVGHRVAQSPDRNFHRPLEADHDDGARRHNLGIDVFGELDGEPGETAGDRKRRLALDRIALAERGRSGRGQHQAGRETRHPVRPAPGDPRAGAAQRPRSSGSP